MAVLITVARTRRSAKLILRYQPATVLRMRTSWPAAWPEHHLETIEAVLERHDLPWSQLEATTLLGSVDAEELEVWTAVERLGRATGDEVAGYLGVRPEEISRSLDALVRRRVVLYRETSGLHYALTPLAADV